MDIIDECEINNSDAFPGFRTAEWMVVLFTEVRDTGSGQGMRKVRGSTD